MGLTVGDTPGYQSIAFQATYSRYENGISTPNGIPVTKSLAFQAAYWQGIGLLPTRVLPVAQRNSCVSCSKPDVEVGYLLPVY
ncbi:MAG: hypothetical protein IKP81_00455 [Paludibacteraceae bacterium]|nr:hypothetical protein [Paludibacteraceae bacterium]